MMAVIQPDAPGQKQLPCTLDELWKIEDLHVPDKYLVRLVRGSVEDAYSVPSTTSSSPLCVPWTTTHAQKPT